MEFGVYVAPSRSGESDIINININIIKGLSLRCSGNCVEHSLCSSFGDIENPPIAILLDLTPDAHLIMYICVLLFLPPLKSVQCLECFGAGSCLQPMPN